LRDHIHLSILHKYFAASYIYEIMPQNFQNRKNYLPAQSAFLSGNF